jgi:hypothetical protein
MLKKSFLLGSILVMVSISSCKIFESTGETKQAEEKQKVDCYAADFKTTEDHFRATSSAYDADETMAKDKALLYSKKAVVSGISHVVSAAASRYIDESVLGKKKNFKEIYLPKINSRIKDFLNQELIDYNIICESTDIMKNGQYRADYSIEVSARTIVDGVNSKLSSGSSFSEFFDPIKFEQVFNEELKKMIDHQKSQKMNNSPLNNN